MSTKSNYNDPQGFEIQYNPQAQTWTVITPCANNMGCAAVTASQTYQAGQFYHIAVTIDTNTVTIYLNGTAVGGAQSYTPTLTGSNVQEVGLGGSINCTVLPFYVNNGGEWHGILDEVICLSSLYYG